jgi:hypothetical protein
MNILLNVAEFVATADGRRRCEFFLGRYELPQGGVGFGLELTVA